MTFEEEVMSLLRPAEWHDDADQAAEDFYDLMAEAEDQLPRKVFLLRSLRNSATELTLRTYAPTFTTNDSLSSDANRRILAKIRNWFTAGIKAEQNELLSVILEVIKKMNIDGRTMAGIKLGKPLIVLIKKDDPSLKAQLGSLQKIAYEAYGMVNEMVLIQPWKRILE
jgi:hypothetical protein